MTILCAALCGLTVWLVILPFRSAAPLQQRSPLAQRNWRQHWPLLTGLFTALVVALLGKIGIGLAVGGIVGTVSSVAQAAHKRRTAALNSERVLAACRELSALLKLGMGGVDALKAMVGDCDVFAEPAALAHLGGDIAANIGKLGDEPGFGSLKNLATAWKISETTGASLAETVDVLTAELAGQQEIKLAQAVELAPSRTTSRLLAVLPLAGVLLGYGLGGDPVGFLVDSILGEIVLVCGAGMACAGILWCERITNA